MIDTFLLVLRTRVRARRHIEDGLPQWMVTPRAYPNRRLREPFRAPKKIHRQIRQPVRQGNTLLVRQFAATAALHLLQERPLDRIGGGLVCGFAFVAVAPLLLGGREGHAAYAGMVTLPSSSPVHSAVRHGISLSNLGAGAAGIARRWRFLPPLQPLVCVWLSGLCDMGFRDLLGLAATDYANGATIVERPAGN